MLSTRSLGRRTADLFRRAAPSRARRPFDTVLARRARPSRRPPPAAAPAESPLDRVPETVVVDDLVFHLDPRQGPTAPLVAAGQFEPTVLATLRHLLSPGDTFVDVGASFGFLSTQLGRHVGPRGNVVVFEPGRQHHSLLLLNLVSNGVLSAEVHPIAVTNRQGLVWYRRLGGDGVVSAFDGNALGLAHHDLVPSSTLDRELGGRVVHAIRLDVAGAEGLVVLGARGVLRSSAPALVVSFEPSRLMAVSKMTGADLLELLRDLGYLVGVIDDADRRPEPAPADAVLALAEAEGGPLELLAWSPLRG